MDVKITGKASHAGTFPEEGVNAIIVASEAISYMKILRIDKNTTANIGSIYAEGPTNIIPDKVEMQFEIRSLSENKAKFQIEHMLECLNRSADEYGASIKNNITCEAKPLIVMINLLNLLKVKTNKLELLLIKHFLQAGMMLMY